MVSSFIFNQYFLHHFAGDEDTNISRRATMHWYMRYAEMLQRQKRITKKLCVDVNQDEIFEYTGHSLNEGKDIDVDTILRKCKVC